MVFGRLSRRRYCCTGGHHRVETEHHGHIPMNPCEGRVFQEKTSPIPSEMSWLNRRAN